MPLYTILTKGINEKAGYKHSATNNIVCRVMGCHQYWLGRRIPLCCPNERFQHSDSVLLFYFLVCS
ncbi:hypothetical protein SBF1_950048 [Candidatus Desulfosporosinus infrequens]|uniref:Uncharacterized protein n=1 Tax=Candidatus Desulfosporosinus infrequens TaxID=2043169 RepID=A0A2U3LXW9_9FIRM|nr:hypothetical protein SBF1_950048 [Candidatus Desulfosporosinus infrequens]